MKTLLFVDDEPKVLQGLQRQLRPMRHEWDMNFAENASQALEFISARPVDIVVSDMMMPGMDGSELFKAIIQLRPQTVRIILSGHSDREAVLRLVGPAHQYISKPCDADELRRAIERAFSLRDLLDNDRLKQLTARIKNLPTLPTAHNQLTEEMAQDSPSVERVGEIIARDIGLTAKILQLVNSAFFGLAQPVTSPAEAVVYLGLNTIRSLVFSAGILSQYDQKACGAFSLEVLARHCWITGLLARRIAQMEHQELKALEPCFLAGLLHDVGQLILAFGLKEEYAGIIARASLEKRPLWQVEQETFGATHADVGAYLLALWGLPNPVIEAVAAHHQPERCAGGEFSPAIAVHAADVFAHEKGLCQAGETPPQLDAAYLARTGCAEQIAAWRDGCHDILEP